MTKLKTLIAECAGAALGQGWDGEGAYVLTEHDCAWIVRELERKPTEEEWAAEGYHWVGSAHVEDA